MGYKRTVRCSHCYQTGHNIMGCPAYKERIEDWREAGIFLSRVEAYDAKKARMSNAKNNRRCSYCGEHGHSRAQCTKLKAAKELFRTKNVEYRENFLKALVDNGIGPGAMIKYKGYYGDTVAIIKDIDWAAVNMAEKNEGVIHFCDVKHIRNIARGDWLTSTRLSAEITGNEHGPVWEMLVPTSSSAILDGCPKDFIGGKKVKGKLIAGKLGMKKVFKNKDLSIHSMKDWYGDFDNEYNSEDFSTELY